MRRLLLALTFICLAFGSARASEPPKVAPNQVIGAFYETLLSTMKKAKELGFKGRYDALAPVIDRTFDMPEMTRRTLGGAADSLTKDQLAKLTEAFRRFNIASYAANFDDWNNEQFIVDDTRQLENGMVVVPTRLVLNPPAEPVSLDYKMHESGGTWTITDVLLQGSVSQVVQRRSEFLSVLRRDGFDALLKAIEKKTESLAGKG